MLERLSQDFIDKYYNKNIYILGDAPNIDQFRPGRVPDNSLIIGLNRAYLRNNIDIHFFADNRFIKDQQDSFDLELTAIHHASKDKEGKIREFGFKRELVYGPIWDIDTDFKGRLRAGHCVLVPALHFALFCNPAKIVLFGVSLRDKNHWSHSSITPTRFPSRARILQEVRLLLFNFPEIEVVSAAQDSLLVDFQIIPYENQYTKQPILTRTQRPIFQEVWQ
jgi:hypothetical protein